ncbi:MAG: response regulator [Selenomonadaceae bacterium]|nr:response regulator [Selenomonadaceae bacterium]
MSNWKILLKGKSNDFLIITGIALLFLTIIAMNVRLIFQMTSNQTEEIGRMQLESIRHDLESKILDSENAVKQVASEAENLLEAGISEEDLTKFFYQKKIEQKALFNGVCFNTYIANKTFTIIPDFDRPATYHARERLWYIGAAENPGKIYITEPYTDAAGNGICFTMSIMLPDNETVVAMDFNFKDLQDFILKMTAEKNRTALIVGKNGIIIGYTDMSLVGEKISQKLPTYNDILERVVNSPTHESFITEINGGNHTIFSSKTKNGWYMIVNVDNWTFYEDSYRQTVLTVLICAVMLIVIVIFYLNSVKNRLETERAMQAKEIFLSRLSKELQRPLQKILKLSKIETLESAESPAEMAAQVRESALKLSDMLDNLFSFSNIISSDTKSAVKNSHAHELSNASKSARLGIVAVLIFAIVVSMFFCGNTTINWGDTKMNREVDGYEYQLSNWLERQRSILNSFVNIIKANPEILDDYEGAVKFLNDLAVNYKDISVCYFANPYREHPVIMNNGWEPGADIRPETRPWYIDTKNSEEGFNVSAPYYDAQTGFYCVTLSQIVYSKSGEFLGIFSIDFFLDKLIHILDASYTRNGYAFLVDKDGIIINHPNRNYQMNTAAGTKIFDTEYKKVYSQAGEVFVLKDFNNISMACLAKKNKTSNFTIIVANNWWDIYGNLVILGFLFVLLLSICIFSVVTLIRRLLLWQQEINRKLKVAAKEAIIAGKAKFQFLAQMSHEIRTPINAVLGMNELILRESTNPAILEYAANIQNAGKTLLTLINSILDFSKIENGQMKIVPVRYDTAILINDLLNLATERAEKKGLKFIIDVDSNFPRALFGDDVRIKQVITNLLSNAIKYTHSGSVTLTMKINSLDSNNVEIFVAVADTGIGIRPEDIGKLSVSFTRLDEEKNRNIEGTGLGISIVQKLLAMMDSKLEIQSIYGKGSNFSFKLNQKIIDNNPIGDFRKQNTDRRQTDKKSKTYFNAKGAKILVVDDNQLNLKVIQGILKYNNVAPDLADSGAHCLELVAQNHYHIIFLDHMMPNMDGIETLKKIKSQNLAGGAKIIALTANAISGAREFYLKAGFDDYLSKPVNPNELESTLKKYLPANLEKISEEVPKVEEVPADSFTSNEKNLLEKICAEINFETAMGYCMDSKEIFVEMMNEFYGGDKTPEIEKFYAAEDWKNYRILVHALKSTSLVIGAENFSAKAKAQESAAKVENVAELKNNHAEFIISYKKLLEQIANWLKETGNLGNRE